MNEKSIDKRVRLYKAICGIIPGGSFIIEYMIDRIPDQRMERLLQFIAEMNERIERLENKDFLKEDDFIFLAEKSIVESTKSYSNKRLKWLASITIPFEDCTSKNEWDYRMKAVNILSNISDGDVEYLLKYDDLMEKAKYERQNGWKREYFVSDGARLSLPDHELFIKNLYNSQLSLLRNSLLSQGLIIKKEGRSNDDFKMTEAGKMFVYIITGKYPRTFH